MSRRFGRNQKRKLREQVLAEQVLSKSLDAQLSGANHVITRQRSRLNSKSRELDAAKQELEAAKLIDHQHSSLTAPRVSLIEIVKHVSTSGQVLRWALLTTRSGFSVTGKPSCSASSANDNEEIGVKIAVDNARQELWPLMGCAPPERLSEKSLAGWPDLEHARDHLLELLRKIESRSIGAETFLDALRDLADEGTLNAIRILIESKKGVA